MVSRQPTIADVARAAGVSTATVDRVINKRRPVKRATAEAVLDASRRLNFRREPAANTKESLREKQIGFVLQKSSNSYYKRLADALRSAAEALPEIQCQAEIRFVEELVPETIVESMNDLSKRVDSLAVVAVDHPLVSYEIISAWEKR